MFRSVNQLIEAVTTWIVVASSNATTTVAGLCNGETTMRQQWSYLHKPCRPVREIA